MAYVYSHTRLDNGIVFYIGIGSTPNHQRAYIRSNRSTHWKRVVNSVGYSVQILFDNLTWDEAQAKEIEQIQFFGRIDLKTGTLINLTAGGDGTLGHIRSAQSRQAMREKMLGRKITDKHRQNLIEAKKKQKYQPQTEEHKAKIGAGNKGKKRSAEVILNLSNRNKGRKLTDEHKDKLRITSSGRKASPETIAKMKASQKELTDSGRRTPMSEANKKMLSEKNRQYKHTPEAIERIRAAVTERRRKDR